MIAAKGKLVIWRVFPEATHDPNEVPGASKWRPKAASSAVEYAVSIAFFPVGKEQRESMAAKGVELSDGAVMGYMGAVGFRPNQKDCVVNGESVYPIASIDAIAPDGKAILYEIIFSAAFVPAALDEAETPVTSESAEWSATDW